MLLAPLAALAPVSVAHAQVTEISAAANMLSCQQVPTHSPVRAILPASGPLAASKATAILGSESALDALKRQQASAVVPTVIVPTLVAPQPARDVALPFARESLIGAAANMLRSVPVAVVHRSTTDRCAQPPIATPDLVGATPQAVASTLPADAIFGTRSLKVSKTPFDKQWGAVGHVSPASRRAIKSVAIARGAGDLEKITLVNSWVNATVRYVDDRKLYRRADYWASAAETLRRRAGDCEDYAIAKMHLLAAAGIARDNMKLVVARDLVRNADHAVLIVKSGDAWLVLDNNTDRLTDARAPQDYRPIMSFSAAGKWLHGYQVAQNNQPAQAVQPVSLASVSEPAPIPALSSNSSPETVTIASAAIATSVLSVPPTAP